ncbi:HIT family protein [Caballeronia sp. BR00000012568055]|jgi:histidine triad (HIT) family protein|uniref:HIT family protein n=1 Tax=Caballeronia sp. BR00000012568055 TaxID=2918761 RepID=UPI0023FA2057|nr:HIT family protein [Caballeronia sp. BR00000012568055]
MSYDTQNIFAKILRGEIPSIKVFESDDTLAFMDVMPQSEGHVLVIPKEAAANIHEASEEALAACMRTVKRVAAAVKEALTPDGMLIAQFNGAAAGQTVEHIHFHIIPRWQDVPLKIHAREFADSAVLEAQATRIRAALAKS